MALFTFSFSFSFTFTIGYLFVLASLLTMKEGGKEVSRIRWGGV